MSDYVQGPYEDVSSTPPATTKVVGARDIDFATGHYTFDADGNPLPSTAMKQRVTLAVSFSAPDRPKTQTRRDRETRRQQVRSALADLVDEGAIRIKRIEVGEEAPGKTRERIVFVDLTNGKEEQVTL